MKCSACFKELNKKEVLYTEDKLPYCPNPFSCNEEHPNSVANILKRGGAVSLYSENELEENIFDRFEISAEMKERILKVATKPQSIRLSKYEIAYYLIALQEERDLASISEAVRYCVQRVMDMEPVGKMPKTEVTPQPVPQYTVDKGNGVKVIANEPPVTIPDIPKSLNVDWDNLPKVQPTPEPQEEEEMTF